MATQKSILALNSEDHNIESSIKAITFQKIAGVCGMMCPIIYILMWIIGGILQPEYNHIRDDVSTLVAVGAPNYLLLSSLNIMTGIFALIFATGLFLHFRHQQISLVGPICLIIYGVDYILGAAFFPLGEGGEKVSIQSQIHG